MPFIPAGFSTAKRQGTNNLPPCSHTLSPQDQTRIAVTIPTCQGLKTRSAIWQWYRKGIPKGHHPYRLVSEAHIPPSSRNTHLKGSILEEGDVVAMVRLLSNVIARAGDGGNKGHHLLSGFCEVIRAECWVWSLFEEPQKARKLPTCLRVLKGEADSRHFAPHLHSARLKPSFFSELQRRYVHSSRKLQQNRFRNVQAECASVLLCSDAGNVPGILFSKAASLYSFSLIGFYRSPDQAAFSPRELRLAEVVLTWTPWLHEHGWPTDGANVRMLPRRQRQTLNLLIHGHSRKEIADRLSISVHTVGEYIKAIYSQYGVRSRAELMRRFPGGLSDET